jgi:O-antigen/teichoic acid export membrane protein
VRQASTSTLSRDTSELSEVTVQKQVWWLARRLWAGAVGPLLSFVALFGLPVLAAVALDNRDFAFWALLSTIATMALSLDFGGVALLVTRYFAEPQQKLLLKSAGLSASGALAIGAIACICWTPYSHTEMGRSIPATTAMAAFLTMSVAAAIRSVLTVVAQAALIASQLALRNVATAGHAVAATAITSALLFTTHSYWALPLGWLASGVIVMCVVYPWSRRTRASGAAEAVIVQPFKWRQFAGLRTLSTLTASVFLNADRWIIGALGGPALLAAYELAWRFAALPRFLVSSLMLRVAADTSSLGRSDGPQLRTLLRGSTLIAAVAGLFSCAPVAAAYWAFADITGIAPTWPMFLAILVAFTVFSVATPLSFSGAAVGNAWLDIPYAAGALAASGVLAIIAAHSDRPAIFIYGYLTSLTIGVCCFFLYAPSLVRRGLQTREAVGAKERT